MKYFCPNCDSEVEFSDKKCKKCNQELSWNVVKNKKYMLYDEEIEYTCLYFEKWGTVYLILSIIISTLYLIFGAIFCFKYNNLLILLGSAVTSVISILIGKFIEQNFKWKSYILRSENEISINTRKK